jgi:hypothetical protein
VTTFQSSDNFSLTPWDPRIQITKTNHKIWLMLKLIFYSRVTLSTVCKHEKQIERRNFSSTPSHKKGMQAMAKD